MAEGEPGGMSAADQAEIIARGRALLTSGLSLQALAVGRELEAVSPRTEAEWRALHSFYIALGSSAWADIMTVRFLAAEPANVPALVTRALFLGTSPTRRDEAVTALSDLLTRDITLAPEWQTLGHVFEMHGLGDRLFDYLERASAADPGKVALRTMIAAHCMTRKNLTRARAEIATIRGLAKGDVGVLFIAMQLAQGLGDHSFVNETLEMALAMAPAGHDSTRGWLICIAANLPRQDVLARLMQETDLGRLDHVTQIVRVLKAVEGRGYIEQERALVARGLALEPENAVLQDASRRLHSSLADRFARGTSAPTAGRPSRSVLQRLAFWR
jgi:hypothetical protein